MQAFAGGFGKAVRGMGRELTGQGNLTAAQEQERLAKSTNSIFNQGGKPPPQDVIDAYKRQNPRAFRQAAAAAAAVPETLYYDDDPYSDQITNANPKDKVVLENGMYNFYENGQLIKQITEQEYNQLLMDPYRTA